MAQKTRIPGGEYVQIPFSRTTTTIEHDEISMKCPVDIESLLKAYRDLVVPPATSAQIEQIRALYLQRSADVPVLSALWLRHCISLRWPAYLMIAGLKGGPDVQLPNLVLPSSPKVRRLLESLDLTR
jgi:hypothetical protein